MYLQCAVSISRTKNRLTRMDRSIIHMSFFSVGTSSSANMEDYLVYTTAPQSPTNSNSSSAVSSTKEESEKESVTSATTSPPLPQENPSRPMEVQPCFLTSLPSFRRLPASTGGLLQFAPAYGGPLGKYIYCILCQNTYCQVL